MLMRPDQRAVFLIGRALANACVRFPMVHVVSVCFVSNHMHLIVYVATDEDARCISKFMQVLDQQIAETLNEHRGRKGHFFADRPRIIPILDLARVVDRMTYTHAQPVHHHLVERVEDWLGFNSFRAVCTGKRSIEASWFAEDAWREAGARRDEIAKYTETVSVPLMTPPMWKSLTAAGRAAARSNHERSVRARERQAAVDRAAHDRSRRPPKPSSHTKLNPFSRPTKSAAEKEREKLKGPQPWAHATEQAEKAFKEAYRQMLAVYRVASARFRATGQLCAFPPGTFPPWVGDALAR